MKLVYVLIALLLSGAIFGKGTTVKWTPPVTRENGDALTVAELGPYQLNIHVGGAVVHSIDIPADQVELRVEDLEQWTHGPLALTMTATDKGGLRSQPSTMIDINISGPVPPVVSAEW